MELSLIHQTVKLVASTTAEIKHQLMRAILWLPDNNPNIKRVGPRGFLMKASMLDNHAGWSVEYYDFQLQYEYLAIMVCETPITKLVNNLQQAMKTGIIRQDNWRLKLNPQVMANLRTIIKEEKGGPTQPA